MSRALLCSVLLWVWGGDSAQPPALPLSVHADESAPIAVVDGVSIGSPRFNLIMHTRLRPAVAARLIDRDIVDMKLSLARELIDEQLVEAAARRRGVVVDEKQIDAAVAELAASFPSRSAWNAYVDSYPEQAAGLRKQMRSRLLREALAGYRASDPINDADSRAYYMQHASVFHVPPHLRAQEIVIALPPDVKLDEIAERRAKAAEAATLAKNPKNAFAALAHSFSDAPNAASLGGDLGMVTKESTEPELWTALNALKPGQTSGVIQTASGLHVLYLVSREPAVDTRFEAARPTIEKALRMVRRSGRVGVLMNDLRQRAQIDNLIARRYMPLSAPYTGARSTRSPAIKPAAGGVSAGPGRD